MHLLGQLACEVQSSLELLRHVWIVLAGILCDGPVEADIASSLVAEFQGARGLLV